MDCSAERARIGRLGLTAEPVLLAALTEPAEAVSALRVTTG